MFEKIIDFIIQYDVFDTVKFFVLSIISVILYKRTGAISNTLKGELLEMKHRLPNYRESEASPSQSFDQVVDTYRLNKSTGELEVDSKLDLQERTNSSRALALCEILDTLEPQITDLDNVIDLNNELQDDLDVMASFEDWRYAVCERYNIDPHLSIDKIAGILNEQKTSVEEEYARIKQSISNNIKEVKDNALSSPEKTEKK